MKQLKDGDNTFKFSKMKIIGATLIVAIAIIAVIATVLIIKKSKINTTKSIAEISTEIGNVNSELSLKFIYQENYWEIYDLTNAEFKTQAEFEDAVHNYIEQIATLLGRKDWYKQFANNTISIYLVIDESIDGGRISFLNTGSNNVKITLDGTIFQHGSSSLVHELTHLVTYNKSVGAPSFSISLSEGIANYMFYYLGKGNTSTVSYGLDIHNFLKEYTQKYEGDATKNIQMSEVRDNMGKSTKRYSCGDTFTLGYWYRCSYSFVDYLVKTYGMENTMVMVRSQDESIYYLFNEKGLDGMVSDWKQFLENYTGKMTLDEINSYVLEWNKTHNY